MWFGQKFYSSDEYLLNRRWMISVMQAHGCVDTNLPTSWILPMWGAFASRAIHIDALHAELHLYLAWPTRHPRQEGKRAEDSGRTWVCNYILSIISQHYITGSEVNEARGGLILAAGHVRSKKRKRTKKHEIPPNTKKTHHGINPQQPGDRDYLETECDETHPTR